MATAQERPATFSIPDDAFSKAAYDPEKRYPMLLELSGEMRARLEDLTRRTGYDQGELINVAVACFMMCLDASEGGKRVGVVEDDREMSIEFSGLHKNDPIDE